MATSYKDLELSRNQKKILIKLKRHPLKKSDIKNDSRYDFLFKYHLVDYSDKSQLYLTVNDKGMFYLRFKFKDEFRFWFPTIISICALIISIVAIIVSVLTR